MVQLVCPACSLSTTVQRRGIDPRCPTCGSGLIKLDDVDRPGAEQDLIVDVREAFEHASFGFSEDDQPGTGNSPRLDGPVPKSSPELGTLTPGTRLGDFEIVQEIGRGGMGVVFKALQVPLNRIVALKVLSGGLHRRGSAVRRFRSEAQAVARLNHPNIVPIYAQGEDQGHYYYAMELIDGTSLDVAIHPEPKLIGASTSCENPHAELAECLQRVLASQTDGVRKPAETPSVGFLSSGPSRTTDDFRHIAQLMLDVADALEHAAEHGVLHRDIKPNNLLLGLDGRLRIVDFGLAQLADEPRLTMSGEVMGTPAYLAPEQIRGDVGSVDHRTDIYALGATLYEVLTLRRPFEGESRDQILNAICTTEPARPQHWDRRIPRDLETICLRAMEKIPAHRYPSATAMAEDLRRFAHGRPILSRPAGILEVMLKWTRRHRAGTVAIAAAAVVVLLAGGLTQTIRQSRRVQAEDALRGAYEQLAFQDYRKPQLVEDAIERAVSMGADPFELGLTQALAELGASEEHRAVERLQALLDHNPADTRALYLLAWARWRSGDREASLAAFDEAERLGGARTADGWFFRGLAAHYGRPTLAIDSYRKANAMRVEHDAFYPQAVLHLARAYNQQLYVARSVDMFAEAAADLRQLVDHGYYGAYPHYLLSIAHRLVAETYEVEPTGEDAALAPDHFAEALKWARQGEAIDPTDYNAVTSEAECLESMGRLEEAIDARTRAIELADTDRMRWEAHHYRWRLYYWTGQLDPALTDLEACAVWSPGTRFYAHVYPSLVYTEAGRMDDALTEAHAILDAEGANVQAVLWSATCL